MPQPTDPNNLMALYAELDAGAEPPQNRRQHPRTPATGHVPAELELNGVPPIMVSVRDLSRSGVGLSCPRPLGVGARVVVRFRLGAGPVEAKCRVVNCREDAGHGRHVVGLAFVEVRRLPPPPPPPVQAAPPPAPDGLQGQMVSATAAMAGADPNAVNEVVQRIAKALAQS